MELELLKIEFSEKYEQTNPLLVELTLWCLQHEYENRPDFIDLEKRIERMDFSNQPFISEIIPLSSVKDIPEVEQKVFDFDIEPTYDFVNSNCN